MFLRLLHDVINKRIKNSDNNNLLERLVEEFSRGFSLIDELSDSTYLKTNNGVGSIGAHIRHNLDFANNFLKGLDEGRIDYNLRDRDIQIEQNRQYAKERFLFLISSLQNLSGGDLTRKVLVCSEIDESDWHQSSIGRELEFLHSHTVHHYALIAEKLNSYGVKVSSEFGVAPSTLKFWATQKAESKVA